MIISIILYQFRVQVNKVISLILATRFANYLVHIIPILEYLSNTGKCLHVTRLATLLKRAIWSDVSYMIYKTAVLE